MAVKTILGNTIVEKYKMAYYFDPPTVSSFVLREREREREIRRDISPNEKYNLPK